MKKTPLKGEIIDTDNVIDIIASFVKDWQYANYKADQPSGIIIHPQLSYKILSKAHPGDMPYVRIVPEGGFELFGVKVFRTVDVQDNEVIVF